MQNSMERWMDQADVHPATGQSLEVQLAESRKENELLRLENTRLDEEVTAASEAVRSSC
jgi:hypothetical protein